MNNPILSTADISEARTLRTAGLSYREIGELMGVSTTTVYLTLNPGKRAQVKAKQRAYRKLRKETDPEYRKKLSREAVEYQRRRRKTDPEFRARLYRSAAAYQKKRYRNDPEFREKRKAAQRKYRADKKAGERA